MHRYASILLGSNPAYDMGLFFHARKAISESDIVLEVLDARFAQLMRNTELEQWILHKRKHLILVVNKSDLASKQTLSKVRDELTTVAPTVFLSATHHSGITRLKQLVLGIANKQHRIIGIIGYPNTGKSSVLNVLVGRKAARTAPQAGFTRGRQRVKMTNELYLLDTPGVIPFEQRDDSELALLGAKSPNQLKDLEGAAMFILDYMKRQNPNSWKNEWGLLSAASEDALEELAIAKKKIAKRGIPDTRAMAHRLILDWQHGKIRV